MSLPIHCRGCATATRTRCIEESRQASPSVKTMMLRAFAARTDTESMWKLLQMDCLLVREEQQAKQRGHSMLRQRLGLDVEQEQEAKEVEAGPPAASPASTVGFEAEAAVWPMDSRTEVAHEAARPAPVVSLEPRKPPKIVARHALVVQGTGHRIALPTDGELILGRFDPEGSFAPDVDFTRDDRELLSTSRRHARISAMHGQHVIEDLGSTNGTRVNDRRLSVGDKVRMEPGDNVFLGHCHLIYDAIPEWFLCPPPEARPRYFLRVDFTGSLFDLPSTGEVVIGRADPNTSYWPDINLGREEEVGRAVSRRHVKVVWRDREHFVEDLGSVNGTKINGRPIKMGHMVRLTPGDHLWLGGCVLTYDVEMTGS